VMDRAEEMAYAIRHANVGLGHVREREGARASFWGPCERGGAGEVRVGFW
jgi:hypothetical protein